MLLNGGLIEKYFLKNGIRLGNDFKIPFATGLSVDR